MTVRGKRQDRGRSGGLSPAAVGVLAALVLTALPPVVYRDGPLVDLGGQEQELITLQPPKVGESGGQSAPMDRLRPVKLVDGEGQVAELTMEDYLWGVVAAEMPASFQPEALKAQACAARTYTVNLQNRPPDKHPQGEICTDSSCCQAYIDPALARARWGLKAGEYSRKITEAVAATDGQGVLYNGSPIQALFFSSAPGRTVDAVEVWGREVSYLKGVDSPEGEEVPNWRSQVVVSREEASRLILERYPQADLSGPPEGWFSQPVENSAGGVASMAVGGVPLSGGDVRGLFGLRSASFTVSWGEEGFTFDVVGYGHGVGMSQYGANALAAQGKTFGEILTWYYTGAEVGALW